MLFINPSQRSLLRDFHPCCLITSLIKCNGRLFRGIAWPRIFLVQELIRHYNRKRISPWVIIKIDLKRPLHSWLGFPRINIGSTCLHTPTYTLAINEGTHDFFPGKQGLRQGDHFSPYLFILSFECLSRLITINTAEDFNFHPKCEAVKLTHLAFVNDLMLFNRADEGSIKILMDSMKDFETPQAYKLTSWSSITILEGINDYQKEGIHDLPHLCRGDYPFRCLRVPILVESMKFIHFSHLHDKLRNYFNGWNA